MPEIIVDEAVGSGGTSEHRVKFVGSNVTVTDRSGAVFTIGFAELIREAYRNRISVSEYGYYSTPNLGFDKVDGKGKAFCISLKASQQVKSNLTPTRAK